jgi:flagellar protein FlgJ
MMSIAMSNAAITTDPTVRHAKLLAAAQQFEGVMLNELMKPLSKSANIDGDEAEGEAGTMQSYGVEAMAGALAKSGALGFAKRIVASVETKEARKS